MVAWGGVLRSFVTQSKKQRNIDGSAKLLVFCVRNRRCQKQCNECLKLRSEMQWAQNGFSVLPKVIYMPDGKNNNE
jgi:hypothetical protein